MVRAVFYFPSVSLTPTLLKKGEAETKPFLENRAQGDISSYMHPSLCLKHSFSNYLLSIHYAPGRRLGLAIQ